MANIADEIAAAMPKTLVAQDTRGVGAYVRSGAPYVWVTAAAIAFAFIITLSLLILTATRGLPHFWPADLVQGRYQATGEEAVPLLVEIRSTEEVTSERLKGAGMQITDDKPLHERLLVKVANRDVYGADFRYLLSDWFVERSTPESAGVFERVEWGNFHGFLEGVEENGNRVADAAKAWDAFDERLDRADDLQHQLRARAAAPRRATAAAQGPHARKRRRRLRRDR